MKARLCRWKCGRKTERRCGICVQCCDARDERNRRIDAGTAPYVPPTERPGHRLYERKQLNSGQKDALVKARAVRKSNLARPNAQPGEIGS